MKKLFKAIFLKPAATKYFRVRCSDGSFGVFLWRSSPASKRFQMSGNKPNDWTDSSALLSDPGGLKPVSILHVYRNFPLATV